MDILDQIKAKYDCNKSARKKIADFIINNTLDTAFLSLKEFAEASSTTEVTVLNYCKDLGYHGFNDFKNALQEFIISNYSPGQRLLATMKINEDEEQHYQRIASSEIKLIKTTYNMNSPATLKKVLDLLKPNATVFIAAHELSGISGRYLEMKFSNQGFKCEMLDIINPYSAISKLERSRDKNKILFTIITTPYSLQTLSLAALVHKENMPVISITDSTNSPIIPFSDATLFCETKLLDISNSPTPIIALINQLASANEMKYKDNLPKKTKPVSSLVTEFNKIKQDLEKQNIVLK